MPLCHWQQAAQAHRQPPPTHTPPQTSQEPPRDTEDAQGCACAHRVQQQQQQHACPTSWQRAHAWSTHSKQSPIKQYMYLQQDMPVHMPPRTHTLLQQLCSRCHTGNCYKWGGQLQQQSKKNA